jgi:hypothetical protein
VSRGFTLPTPVRRRSVIYIDGFNLYYGVLRSAPSQKWLDLEKFCRLLRPHDEIRRIRYFSAPIVGPTKPNQDAYLKALSSTPLVNIILGKFKEKTMTCRVLPCNWMGDKKFKAREEKRTDVAIATYMMTGPSFCTKRCERVLIPQSEPVN